METLWGVEMVYQERRIKRIEDDWIDDDIYSENFRELLIEDDAISVEEEGFMRGYNEAD